MTGTCVICGNDGEIQIHHVAGENNDPFTTVPVCVPCHGFLTSHQWVAGVNLYRVNNPGLLDRFRATVGGVFAMREAHLIRMGRSREAHQMRVVGRWWSAFLDLFGPADRDGRLSPNSRLRRSRLFPQRSTQSRSEPVGLRFEAELQRVLDTSPVILEANAVIRSRLEEIPENTRRGMFLIGAAVVVVAVWQRVKEEAGQTARMTAFATPILG